MKKGFSIFITALILASGMHLSMASHLCQGEVMAVKWSFSGKLAGCGMEAAPVKSCPVHDGIASNCCQNKITYLSVDNGYYPSTLQVEDPVKRNTPVFALVLFNYVSSIKHSVSLQSNVSPPGKPIANEVNLADICVYRI